MRHRAAVSALLTLILLLGACSRAPKQGEIEQYLKSHWHPCPYGKVSNVKIVSADKKVVRVSYTLTLQVDGRTVKPEHCPRTHTTLIEALANEDLVNLRRGQVVEVTQELGLK
jgi:hypothetical protein